LKHNKKKNLSFIDGDTYIADKIKIIVNKKGEIVIISTSLTVFRAEKDDTFTVESLELSQRDDEVKDHGPSNHYKSMDQVDHMLASYHHNQAALMNTKAKQ